jgi:hypothetical protein
VAVAAGNSLDGDRWQSMFDALMDTIAPRFARVEPRRRVRGFVSGLRRKAGALIRGASLG